VFDVDASHDPPFLVMEYVDGVSLQAAVARFGTFAPGEAAAVRTQVALGLCEAAAVGLVHRDIKPANVLADRKGGVKILDLGIARLEGDPISRRVNTVVVLGTLDYLAPEQAEDSSEVDTRVDLYGLGATLYFLLAGHPPYPDDDIGRKMALKQSADPTPIHLLRPDVPVPLSAVLSRLLARDPDGRYSTPAETAAALDSWADPGPDFPARLFRPWPPEAV
jgi:serine/threonine-protein kinase